MNAAKPGSGGGGGHAETKAGGFEDVVDPCFASAEKVMTNHSYQAS